jgi:hypothetical protein
LFSEGAVAAVAVLVFWDRALQELAGQQPSKASIQRVKVVEEVAAEEMAATALSLAVASMT